MHEIFANAVNYVNPHVYGGIEEIEKIWEEERKRVLGSYNWNNSAKKLRELFMNL